VPNAAGDAPVPVLHSPPRKLTPQDHDDWKIPPCISQWKNTKVPTQKNYCPKPLTFPQGYTIPLHMRLAADGRGAQTVEINDKFAHFNESLSIAQEAAREGTSAIPQHRISVILLLLQQSLLEPANARAPPVERRKCLRRGCA
jgi:SNW domain-containing protein 1